MRSTENAHSRDTSEMTRWTHTGIEAPYLLTLQNDAETDTRRGMPTDLVHPHLGVIGRIVDGDPTLTAFEPSDRARFSHDDLADFLRQTQQDGQPVPTGAAGVHLLLKEVINEARYANMATQLRGTTHFLLRSYTPRTEDDRRARRGPVVRIAKIPHLREARQALVGRLATQPDTQLPPGAHWQMFNGETWTDLLRTPEITASEMAERSTAMRLLVFAAGGTLLDGQEWDNGLYITGTLATGMVTLVADPDPIKFPPPKRWCEHDPESVSRVRFEWWNVHKGLLATSGTVHGDATCQRLVTLD